MKARSHACDYLLRKKTYSHPFAVPNAMISALKVAFATRKRHLSEKKVRYMGGRLQRGVSHYLTEDMETQ